MSLLVMGRVWYVFHSPFVPKGVSEASQVFFRDSQVFSKLFSYKDHC
jgi:hypothetical protein